MIPFNSCHTCMIFRVVGLMSLIEFESILMHDRLNSFARVNVCHLNLAKNSVWLSHLILSYLRNQKSTVLFFWHLVEITFDCLTLYHICKLGGIYLSSFLFILYQLLIYYSRKSSLFWILLIKILGILCHKNLPHQKAPLSSLQKKSKI